VTELAQPQYKLIETRRLFTGKLNVRRAAGDVTELTKSIESQGLLEPLVVRPSKGKYEVVVGLRRFTASKAAGLRQVPVIIREMNDEEAIASSLIENIQRQDIDAEEEYDALMALQRLNPKLYGKDEQLAKVVGKSRQHIGDVITAVKTLRAIRKETKTKVQVKYQPEESERQRGESIPLSLATLVHSAEQSPTVQELPESRRTKALGELARTIAPLPKPAATKVRDAFIRHPDAPIEKLKEEVLAEPEGQHLHIYIRPRVAIALEKVAKERDLTMEEMAPIAIEEYLRQAGYLRA
jgi:ParB/RepB/Spo0J family partition protein